MKASPDNRIAALAAGQHGTFSRAQALGHGATKDLVRSRLETGRWARCAPGVYGLPGVPPSFLRDLWVAHLAVGPVSVVSHEAAAALHRLTGFPRRAVTLTASHGSHPRVVGAVVHQLRDLHPGHLTTLEGLPATTVARTLVDLAAVARRGRLEVALDDAVAARLVSVPDVGRCLASVARRGKPGVQLLSTLLDARGPGYVPPASRLERALFRLLAEGGEPPPRRQFPFPGRAPGDGRVDAAYVEARLIVKVDGRRWHTRVADLARDHARDNEAARAGWQTLRLLYEDVLDAPQETCRRRRACRASPGRREPKPRTGGNRGATAPPIASGSAAAGVTGCP